MKVSITRHMEIEMNGDEYDVIVHGLQVVAKFDGTRNGFIDCSPDMSETAQRMLEELAAADTKHMF